MFKFVFKLKVQYLIIPLSLALILYISSFFLVFLPYMENSIIEKKKELVQEVTNSVWSILDFYDKKVKDGSLTISEAQLIAISNIKEIKYGKEKKDYLWINDFHPMMIMHPYLPELDSTDLSQYKDPDGTYLFNEMVNIVKNQSEGFLQYKWQLKDDTAKILPKISFVKEFKPWNWIIGSGVYIDDIEYELALIKKRLVIISLAITLIAILLYLYVIIRGYKKDVRLKEIEVKHRKIFEEANDGILLLKDNKFIDCNPKALKLFKSSKTDLIGKTVADFSTLKQSDGENSAIKGDKIIKNCLNGKNQFFEWRHKTFDNKTFIAEVSLSSIEINHEIYLLSFIRDISKRKKDESNLIEAMEKAEASDKLKSAFLANMSHEIRTPMNGILGFAQLMRDGVDDKEKFDEYIEIILGKGKQLLQIINDIVDISKIESSQLNINYTDFSLNDLMNELYAFFRIYNKNVELKVKNELPDSSSFIRSDYTRLTQIISNLLTNAFKFTQKGFIEFGYRLNSENLYIYVQDSGIGVKKENQEIIFDRFRQSDESTSRIYGGTGLGLSISKGLVKLLGGNIGVESDGENGSLFYFTIPYKGADDINIPKENINKVQNIDWSNKVILIVEDDMVSYQYIDAILRETNAEIHHVESGQDAIEFVQKIKTDVVLMDIQLPGIDGNDATREIRKFNKDIPIIAQTAYAMADDREKSIKAGCNDYLAKPINSNDLLDKIQIYLL